MARDAVSLVALAATGYSRVLGQRLMDQQKVPAKDGTTPVEDTPPDVRKIQHQLKVLRYANPAHLGALIAISAVMGEQQRTTQVARGVSAACCAPPREPVRPTTSSPARRATPGYHALAQLAPPATSARRRHSPSRRTPPVEPVALAWSAGRLDGGGAVEEANRCGVAKRAGLATCPRM